MFLQEENSTNIWQLEAEAAHVIKPTLNKNPPRDRIRYNAEPCTCHVHHIQYNLRAKIKYFAILKIQLYLR
jgi:hypothetical protein